MAAVSLALVGALTGPWPARAVSVADDNASTVSLAHPARRIVSLSPGITELLFGMGAGALVVGVSAYSDFPAAALDLPQVARAQGIDLERIAALNPDLIITWGSGYSPALLDALRRLNVPVYVLEPRSLESIAASIERLGVLSGSAGAPGVAAAFRERLTTLRQHYAHRRAVRVFYQVWNSPIMTLSGGHIASEVMRTCGARNVFEDLAPLVATVDVEAVIAARPEILLTAEPGAVDRGALEGWRRYPQLPAVAAGRLVTLDADKLDRGSTRVLDATEELCGVVEGARKSAVPAETAR
jgi:iron complex transport system substrate-binding protein